MTIDEEFWGDPVAYYYHHYDGITRGNLSKLDRKLYHRLWRDDLLEFIPKKVTRFAEGYVNYYKKHYNGMTRGELKKTDKSLYQSLWYEGLLGKIPRKRKQKK